MQANLVVRSLDGKAELPIAKVVEYKGRQIVHAYVYAKYQRHSIHAWGVRYPLCKWMLDHEITDLYLWDNKAGVTYCINLDEIRVLGTRGEQDRYGGTLNVERDQWETIEHKLTLPWVPDSHQVVLPQCTEPWPLPEREPPPPVKSKPLAKNSAPAVVQEALF